MSRRAHLCALQMRFLLPLARLRQEPHPSQLQVLILPQATLKLIQAHLTNLLHYHNIRHLHHPLRRHPHLLRQGTQGLLHPFLAPSQTCRNHLALILRFHPIRYRSIHPTPHRPSHRHPLHSHLHHRAPHHHLYRLLRHRFPPARSLLLQPSVLGSLV